MPDILLKERHRERRTAQFTETAPADLFLRQFPVSASPEHHGRTESAYRKRFSSDQITGDYWESVFLRKSSEPTSRRSETLKHRGATRQDGQWPYLSHSAWQNAGSKLHNLQPCSVRLQQAENDFAGVDVLHMLIGYKLRRHGDTQTDHVNQNAVPCEIVGANGGGSRKNAAKQIEVNDSLYDDGEE